MRLVTNLYTESGNFRITLIPFNNLEIIKPISHLKQGLYFKIPLCCILNFIIDNIISLGTFPLTILRSSGKVDYTPCWIHYLYYKYIKHYKESQKIKKIQLCIRND